MILAVDLCLALEDWKEANLVVLVMKIALRLVLPHLEKMDERITSDRMVQVYTFLVGLLMTLWPNYAFSIVV